MKICFAFPNKNNSRIFYIFDAETGNRLQAVQDFDKIFRENKYQNNSCQLFLINPQSFRLYLEKNDYDYGLILWNDIMQEFYITQRSLDYE